MIGLGLPTGGTEPGCWSPSSLPLCGEHQTPTKAPDTTQPRLAFMPLLLLFFLLLLSPETFETKGTFSPSQSLCSRLRQALRKHQPSEKHGLLPLNQTFSSFPRVWASASLGEKTAFMAPLGFTSKPFLQGEQQQPMEGYRKVGFPALFRPCGGNRSRIQNCWGHRRCWESKMCLELSGYGRHGFWGLQAVGTQLPRGGLHYDWQVGCVCLHMLPGTVTP